MVEVFKTNIQDKDLASKVITSLHKQFPEYILNFDLEDCDKILRVESESINKEMIIFSLGVKGILCEVLMD